MVAHVAHVASFQQKVVMYQWPSVRGLVAHKAAHSWHTWHTPGRVRHWPDDRGLLTYLGVSGDLVSVYVDWL